MRALASRSSASLRSSLSGRSCSSQVSSTDPRQPSASVRRPYVDVRPLQKSGLLG